MYQVLVLFCALLLCSSCNAPTDHKEESLAIVLQLCLLLEKIENSEQLEAKSAHLKRLFNALSEQMIVANNQISTAADFSQAEKEASERLRLQLNRACNYRGGYEIIERCQAEALHRLTTYSLKPRNGN